MLAQAIKRGLVKIMATGSQMSTAQPFVERILQAVERRGHYPLLDYGRLRNIEASPAAPSRPRLEGALARGKHAFLARNLMERLPTFDEATLDEVLDVKKELQSHLIRFRSALMKFSEGVAAAPWTEDFSAECDDWFVREVEPAILEITEAVESNKLHSKLARGFIDKPLTLPTTSGLSLLLADFDVIPHLVAGALGFSAATGMVGYDAVKNWREETKAAERNGLFLYYRLRQKL